MPHQAALTSSPASPWQPSSCGGTKKKIKPIPFRYGPPPAALDYERTPASPAHATVADVIKTITANLTFHASIKQLLPVLCSRTPTPRALRQIPTRASPNGACDALCGGEGEQPENIPRSPPSTAAASVFTHNRVQVRISLCGSPEHTSSS